MSYKASAPANLMLIGEYAVINGNPAVACTVNKRLHVTLQPLEDDTVLIESELGEHTTTIQNLQADSPFDLPIACLQQFKLPSGCKIIIDSEFSSTMGLGSSAALVAALCHCLSQWTQQDTCIQKLWSTGIKAIRSLSPHASGTDLAASLQGGVILFKNNPLYIEKIPFDCKISVIYSGSKLTSQQAVESHAQKQAESPKFINALESTSNQLVTEFIVAVEENNWGKAGKMLNAAHGLLHTLGVSSERLDSLAWLLRETCFGAKISGSGLGDCVIGIGSEKLISLTEELQAQGCQQLSLKITLKGTCNDSK